MERSPPFLMYHSILCIVVWSTKLFVVPSTLEHNHDLAKAKPLLACCAKDFSDIFVVSKIFAGNSPAGPPTTFAYHQGTSDFNRLTKENSFLSTQNFGLLVTVAGLLADMDKMQMKECLQMDKMHEELGRVYKENLLLHQEVDNLNFRLNSEVENLNTNTIRDLENDLSDHHASLVGRH